jgi:hypothetical protein
MDKVLAKSVHLGLGLDLLGSKTSLNSKRGNELEVTALGVKAKNAAGRVVLIPWANIKGVELAPEEPSEIPVSLGPQEPKPRQPKK